MYYRYKLPWNTEMLWYVFGRIQSLKIHACLTQELSFQKQIQDNFSDFPISFSMCCVQLRWPKMCPDTLQRVFFSMFKYGQQYSQHCFRKNCSNSSCSVERHMMFAWYLLSHDACNAYHYFRLSQSMCKTQNYNQRNSKTRKVSYSTKE